MTADQQELLERIAARIPTFPFTEDDQPTNDRAAMLAKVGLSRIVANLLKPGSVQAKERPAPATKPAKAAPPLEEEEAPVRSRRPA